MTKDLKMPDLTKAQMLAIAKAIILVCAALGLPLSDANANRLTAVAIVVPTALIVADAAIRIGRALMMGRKVTDEDLGLD